MRQTIGTGMAMIIRSVSISVVVKTVSTVRVSVHFVKNVQIGAQLSSHTTPHWKSVAKKNAVLHAIMIPIITQHILLKARTAPKMRRHRSRTETLIRPKAGFSVVCSPYLY